MSKTAETDLYDDLYTDDSAHASPTEDLEDLIDPEAEDEQVIVVTTLADAPNTTKLGAATSTASSSAGGAHNLPAKPTSSPISTDVSTQDQGLSYSAQIARQFSSYSQTPSQERQQRSEIPLPSNPTTGKPAPIATLDGGRPGVDRPVRPSEMKDEGKMFVGGLSWDTTDEGLRQYFSQFGKVDACTILRDPDGRSRGFAFLTFEDPESVNAVMIREHFLDNKAIDPKRAIPREEHLRNTRYFLGGLSPSSTAESVKEFFSAYGKVVDATVMADRETGRSKGFGFVTFEDASHTQELVGQQGLTLDGKQIEVKLAQPRNQRDQTKPLSPAASVQSIKSSFSNEDTRNPIAVPNALGMPGGGAQQQQQQQQQMPMPMFYQRVMNQMPMMGNGMMMGMNPMMGMSMGMGGMGGMGSMGAMGMNNGMGSMGMAGANNPSFPGATAAGGMGNAAAGGMGINNGMPNMGAMQNMGGMQNMNGGGAGGGGGMPGMPGMGSAMNGMSGAGMMGAAGGPLGANPAIRMGVGPMGMGMGAGGMMPMMGMNAAGMNPAFARMQQMNAAGLGPARSNSRGQHHFHPYAR